MMVFNVTVFCTLIFIICLLQSATSYFYFKSFFHFRVDERVFFIITFIYMLMIKVLSVNTLTRLAGLFVFLFILSIIFFSGILEKKFYHVLSFIFSLTLCELTFSTIISLKGIQNLKSEFMPWIIISLLVNIGFLGCMILLIRFFSSAYTEESQSLSHYEYLYLSIIPLASLVIIYLTSQQLAMVSKIISCSCLILINLSYYIICRCTAKKNLKLQNLNFINAQNSYYRERLKNQQELKKMRHDLKNILIAMDSFIEQGNMDAIKEQLKLLMQAKVLCHDEFTGCAIIDTILNVKLQSANNANVKCLLDLQIPSDLIIGDQLALEVCAIFGNLIDNAIEGVKRLDNQDNRRVKIIMRYEQSKLIFNIQNMTHLKQKNFSQSYIESEKLKGRNGIGITSVKERVDHLNGFYDFTCENNIFNALIILPIK
ncbi:MAG: sensor histidine kinase [Intestinibaculum porci]|uniref:sensor histidine kinase n=1 Tax=Intestinibaculum porci TaxID=2487118 RepID=UPI003EFD4B98